MQDKNIEEVAERGLLESMANRTIENIVTRLSSDVLELTKFAYQLRKIDITNSYSSTFLYGNVMP